MEVCSVFQCGFGKAGAALACKEVDLLHRELMCSSCRKLLVTCYKEGSWPLGWLQSHPVLNPTFEEHLWWKAEPMPRGRCYPKHSKTEVPADTYRRSLPTGRSVTVVCMRWWW